MSKYFLIQKTPTLDVILLERMKLGPIFHVVFVRHPFLNVWSSVLQGFKYWLNVWYHVLQEQEQSISFQSAVVNYEALVLDHSEVAAELGLSIREGCRRLDEKNTQRLELQQNVTNLAEYLKPKEVMLNA